MRRNLRFEQFFHVSPDYNRESIEQHGLNNELGSPQWEETESRYPGNYLFRNVNDARVHARNMASAGLSEEGGTQNYYGDADRFDLYEVTVPGHLRGQVIREDPLLSDADVTDRPIPRGWVRRRESIGPWGNEY